MFICDQCNNVNLQVLYVCVNEHSNCEKCIVVNTDHETSDLQCPICGAFNLIKHEYEKNSQKMNNYESDNLPQPSNSNAGGKKRITVVSKNKYVCTTKRPALRVHASSSIFYLSKRPGVCPSTKCMKLISITQISSHFTFEHPRIPQELVQFGESKYLEISLNSMPYNESHVVAVILVPIAVEKENITYIDNSFTFPLVAARIFLFKTLPTITTTDDLIIDNEESPEMIKFEAIIVWICGNTDGTITCTIEAAPDEKSKNVHTFHGPINSLRDPNDPYSVYMRNDCLIIPSESTNIIEEVGRNPIESRIQIFCNKLE